MGYAIIDRSDGMPERLTDEIVQANADCRDDVCVFSGVLSPYTLVRYARRQAMAGGDPRGSSASPDRAALMLSKLCTGNIAVFQSIA